MQWCHKLQCYLSPFSDHGMVLFLLQWPEVPRKPENDFLSAVRFCLWQMHHCRYTHFKMQSLPLPFNIWSMCGWHRKLQIQFSLFGACCHVLQWNIKGRYNVNCIFFGLWPQNSVFIFLQLRMLKNFGANGCEWVQVVGMMFLDLKCKWLSNVTLCWTARNLRVRQPNPPCPIKALWWS